MNIQIGSTSLDGRLQSKLCGPNAPLRGHERRIEAGSQRQIQRVVIVARCDPKGNPAKVGVVVATRRLPLGGCTEGTQQWICEAVVPEVSPLNVTSTCNVCAAGSKTTVAKPVPVVAVGGISAAPVRLAPKVIGVANAADDPANATAVARTNAESSDLISPSPKSKSQRSRVLALRKPVVRA